MTRLSSTYEFEDHLKVSHK